MHNFSPNFRRQYKEFKNVMRVLMPRVLIFFVLALWIKFLELNQIVPRGTTPIFNTAAIAGYIGWILWKSRQSPQENLAPISFRAFFTEDEEKLFIKQINEYCVKYPERGLQLAEKDPHHYFLRAADGFEHGLLNLAQKCHQIPLDTWGSIVEEHFRIMEQSESEDAARGRELQIYERAAPRLRVRLVPNGQGKYLRERGLWTINRQVLDDLYEIVMIDYDKSNVNLSKDLFDRWEKTEKEIFDRALENIRAQELSPTISKEIEGARVYMMGGGASHYAAEGYHFIGEYPESKGKYGCIFAIPNRHNLIYIPIDDMKSIAAFHQIMGGVWQWYFEGPGSITPAMYWKTNEGKMIPLYSQLIKDKYGNPVQLNFIASDEFTKLINRIGKDTHNAH